MTDPGRSKAMARGPAGRGAEGWTHAPRPGPGGFYPATEAS